MWFPVLRLTVAHWQRQEAASRHWQFRVGPAASLRVSAHVGHRDTESYGGRLRAALLRSALERGTGNLRTPLGASGPAQFIPVHATKIHLDRQLHWQLSDKAVSRK